MTTTAYFYPIVPTLNFVNDYKNEYYWPSAFTPAHIYENPIARIPFILLEAQISALSISSFGVLTLLAAIHGSVLTYWTRRLR